ncbi:Imm3 family immunity protein [Lysinibacillus agricola]|uniref:Imm3 family immunity protein n=1 Tax=Lysinibacillus agricola TaxID=2590012 RepID=UPI003C24760D
MFEKITYEELMEYVPNDFDKFVSDGLSSIQAVSRLINEYENQTDDYEDVRWMFTVLLAEIGVKYECSRDEIKIEALNIINDKKLVNFWIKEGINDTEIINRVSRLKNVKNYILRFDSNI